MNKIMLIGNLGKDPEFQYTQAGVAVANFTLAVNHVTKTEGGEKQQHTDWFSIIVWRQLAELCNQYLHKGSKIFVEGRLQQRKYTDKNGVERTAIEVIASDVEFLDTRKPTSQTQEEPA